MYSFCTVTPFQYSFMLCSLLQSRGHSACSWFTIKYSIKILTCSTTIMNKNSQALGLQAFFSTTEGYPDTNHQEIYSNSCKKLNRFYSIFCLPSPHSIFRFGFHSRFSCATERAVFVSYSFFRFYSRQLQLLSDSLPFPVSASLF